MEAETGQISLDGVLARVFALADGQQMEAADADALTQALEHAPYFTAAGVLLLRHGGDLLDDIRRKALQDLLALGVSDRRSLVFAKYGDEWAHFYPEPDVEPGKATEDVIDTFLRTYGSCTPEEERQLERMIFNPTPDYAELLARQEQSEVPAENEAPEGTQDALINAFIRSQHPMTHPVEESPAVPEENSAAETPAMRPEVQDDSLLSESLARMFIRKQRYERAFEIISGLSLKFPKKSAYFADQLRFLQKLIINQRRLQELSQADTSKK